MSLNVSDAANWAQILSLPLTWFVWFFTRERFSEFWKRWQRYIFAFATGLAIIALYFFGWLNWLWHPLTWRVWSVSFLAVGAFSFGYAVRAIIHTVRHPAPPPPQPDVRNYVNDEIFGVIWSWNYYGGRISSDPIAFCPIPDCRCRLEAESNAAHMLRDGYTIPVSLTCPRCGFRREFQDNVHRLLEKVTMEIERRINTGQFVHSQRLQLVTPGDQGS